MNIKITSQYDNYMDSKAEKAIFGDKFALKLDLVRISEKGIFVKPNFGNSYDVLLIPAKECITKGKTRDLTFDSDEIEKFMKNLPFASRQAANKRNHVLEVKLTLEQTMGIKIIINDNLEITSTKGKALGNLFAGYNLMDIIENADLAVNAAQLFFRKSEKAKDAIKKQFHEDMEKRGIIRGYYI
jgi:hypothetical protein